MSYFLNYNLWDFQGKKQGNYYFFLCLTFSHVLFGYIIIRSFIVKAIFFYNDCVICFWCADPLLQMWVCVYIYAAWSLGSIFDTKTHVHLQFWRTINLFPASWLLIELLLDLVGDLCLGLHVLHLLCGFYSKFISRRYCFPSGRCGFHGHLCHWPRNFPGP